MTVKPDADPNAFSGNESPDAPGDSACASVKRAKQLILANQPGRARLMLEQLIEREPDADAFVTLATIETGNPRSQAAVLNHLKKALELSPQHTEAWLMLANYWGLNRQPETAAKANVITTVIAVFISSSFRTHQHGPYSRAAAGCRAVVALCRVPTWAAARKDDSVCRMGGEEFLVVCRNTELKATLQAAERLRKKVNALRIKAAAAEIQVSLSIGVAIRESDMPEADALVNAADKALYAAKLSGRNQTCLITQGKVQQTRS